MDTRSKELFEAFLDSSPDILTKRSLMSSRCSSAAKTRGLEPYHIDSLPAKNEVQENNNAGTEQGTSPSTFHFSTKHQFRTTTETRRALFTTTEVSSYAATSAASSASSSTSRSPAANQKASLSTAIENSSARPKRYGVTCLRVNGVQHFQHVQKNVTEIARKRSRLV